jgi:hypothetical protein
MSLLRPLAPVMSAKAELPIIPRPPAPGAPRPDLWAPRPALQPLLPPAASRCKQRAWRGEQDGSFCGEYGSGFGEHTLENRSRSPVRWEQAHYHSNNRIQTTNRRRVFEGVNCTSSYRIKDLRPGPAFTASGHQNQNSYQLTCPWPLCSRLRKRSLGAAMWLQCGVL